MRIVFFSLLDSAPWGGSEELWSAAARRLVANGHSVGACLTGWPEVHPRVAELSSAGVDLHFRRLVFPPLHRRLLRRLRRSPPENLAVGLAERWILARRPDLVVLNHGGMAFGVDWMLRCRQLGLPYVSLAHGADERFWPSDSVIERLTGAYGGARRAFFVSAGNRACFEEQMGQRLSHAEVVRNTFNVDYDIDMPWPASNPTWRIACVARLEPDDKGQDVLFRVLQRPEWRARPLHVNLFGGGSRRLALERLAHLLDLRNVTFAGYRSPVHSIWAEHHALVLPSRVEGLPIALVEAMLCARPAIVSNIPGNAELVEDNVTGFVVPAPAESLLAATLERAWEQRSRWETMGRAARSAVRQAVPRDPAAEFALRLLALAGSAA